ncbi:D-serine ammonia-lyase [Achromobacter sp. ACM04]|uniref:Probable D-serine dehydratase n=1 Tax=Achromobacter aegrifaciens TaxID=1287736 RepID=A0ABU2D6Z9_ACHAE|nr:MULTISPECIES: D-serine ammonia-lyase [Achromobacter]MBD9421250.1 D-serine ammonia-lyase [Achromobacter sp. ACM04]MDR7943883.1 D-serine ammonia-lyase [Achromobacter aegrifaciens]
MMTANFDPQLLENLQSRTPLLWLNPARGGLLPGSAPSLALIDEAENRLARCAPLLAALFPELAAAGGHIESRLMPAKALQQALGAGEVSGSWYLKRDDELPVAGSIKARGGFHEVLAIAESIALEHGLLKDEATDRRIMATPQARALFSQYAVTVGSTGNLGMSIGVMAAALGFDAVVHMSADAKEWKKDRLRKRGVRVVEHAGDYAEAVAAGRAQALAAPRSHFVDDEQSELLFFGYAAAARGLARQLAEAGRVVDAAHPLFVYIPCGVGGAPGGISHGLKALFGPNVHCFFAEPVASPCFLVQLASGADSPVSVYDIGLDNRTEADGLAVGQASELVASLMRPQLGGVFTVSDDELYLNLLALKDTLGVEVEPSAAAAVSGPGWLDSAAGQVYASGIDMSAATHVIWATGGSLVPPEALRGFQEHARQLSQRRAA